MSPDSAANETLDISHVEGHQVVSVCTTCKATFESDAQLDSHMDAAHSNYKCDFCERNFLSEALLTKHKNERHPAAYIQCKDCMLRVKAS